MTDITPELALWVQQLRAIAQTGLAFNPPVYDRERYDALLHLAATMAATVNHGASLDPALADAFAVRWRAEVVPGVPGYVTPKVGVGALVFNARDELLLIQRAEGAWLFPTGWAEVGMSPPQVVVKEVAEETGLRVTPLRVVGVYDSLKWRGNTHPHLYSIVFYCRRDGGELRPHPIEVRDLGFFARDALPEPLFVKRTDWFDHAWAAHRGERVETYFDR